MLVGCVVSVVGGVVGVVGVHFQWVVVEEEEKVVSVLVVSQW